MTHRQVSNTRPGNEDSRPGGPVVFVFLFQSGYCGEICPDGTLFCRRPGIKWPESDVEIGPWKSRADSTTDLKR
jgi:hypothetical protein